MATKNFNIIQPPSVLSIEERAIEMGRNDLIKFGKYFLWSDFDKSESPFFHYEIGDALLDNSTKKQLAIIIARGHAKTTLIKAYILHNFLYLKKGDPPLFYGWVSDSLGKSYRNIAYVSNHIKFNERIVRCFGPLCGEKHGRVWNKQDIALTNDCTLISRSNAKNIRGETTASVIGGAQRYNRILLDDIENEENTKTYESRENLKKIVTNAIYPALDMHNGRLIFTGTPVHSDSLCQNIIDGWGKAVKEGKEDEYSWLSIIYKATQPRMEGGVLWHSYIPKEKLQEKKQFYIDNNNISGYFQEYELEPQGQENKIWTRDHYKIHDASYYYENGQSFLNWRGEIIPINCHLGSDPSTDIKTRNSDNSVIMVIGIAKDKRIFVLEYISKLAIPPLGIRDEKGELLTDKGVVDYIFELYDRYHCKNGTVEDVGMTRGVWKDISAEKYRMNRFDMIIIPIEPQGKEKLNKIIRGLNTYFSFRLIHVREDHYLLRSQIENMGPTLGHDDEIETLFFSVQNMQLPDLEKKGVKFLRPKKKKQRSWVTA